MLNNIYKQKHLHAQRQNLRHIPEDQDREDGGDEDEDYTLKES